MTLNQTIIANCTITNVGEEKLRFLDYSWPGLLLLDRNGTRPVWVGPIKDIREPNDSDFVILNPGESISKTRGINKYYYLLNLNETYNVTASYSSHNWKKLTKSYWQGKVVSNEETFFVGE
jgi:hypothetical protein